MSGNTLELAHVTAVSSSKPMLDQLDKLLSTGFEFLDLLCRETPSYTGDGKKLAKHLIAYFKGDPRKMLWVVLWATTKEIETATSNETLFRESNVQTELMFAYFYTERGKTYLSYLLRPLFNVILKHPPVAQYTPEFKQFQQMLVEQLPAFVDRFVLIDTIPLEFMRVFRHMKKEMSKKFPAADAQVIILSLFFLRVICPVFIQPEILDFTIPLTHMKLFTTCAKALQALANGSLYDNDDGVMSTFNSFLTTNIPRVRKFFSSVIQELPAGGVPELEISIKEKKKESNKTTDALMNIMKTMNEDLRNHVANEHRKVKGAEEFESFKSILDSQKWKLWKQRPDTQTWTAKGENFFAIKICGSVRTPLKSLQDYVHSNKIIRSPPHFVKGGSSKVYDDYHIDLSETKFGASKDYLFYKNDPSPAEEQKVSLIWCLENQRKSGGITSLLSSSSSTDLAAGPWGAFKAVGYIIQPLPENPTYSWLVIVFNLERKTSQSSDGMDTYLYKTLQRVRSDTETSDSPPPSPPSTPPLTPIHLLRHNNSDPSAPPISVLSRLDGLQRADKTRNSTEW